MSSIHRFLSPYLDNLIQQPLRVIDANAGDDGDQSDAPPQTE
jgi:hypothetical protein